MARFSSVAYEDPPNTNKNAIASSDIVEQFVDCYGVSITRPTPHINNNKNNNNSNNNNNKIDNNGNNNSPKTNHNLNKDAQNDNTIWNMAHMDAMSPRPLMLMLSNCNTSGMPKSTSSQEEKSCSELENARFQWVALATSQETSAQFDSWRITSSSDATTATNIEGDESDAILVIAFRGTRLLSAVDLLTDIQLRQDMIQCSDFGVCMDNDDNIDDDGNDGDDGNNKLMAHSGFLGAYTSIRSSLLQLLSDNAGKYDRIWFTGHSLGAAMATLAVVDVGSIMNGDSQFITVTSKISSSASLSAPDEQTLHIPKAKSLSSYLFGTPRVGNRTFANRLARLQHQPNPILQEYYRVNTPGDAVVFLPRGKVVNRLDIDYVHAGASVFLPTLSSPSGVGESKGEEDDDRTKNGYSRKMMQLEEDTIEQINQRIFESDDGNNGGTIITPRENSKGTMTASTTTSDQNDNNNRHLSTIRIYPKGDQPPDPLSEIDPSYSGFFPLDPRTWTSSSFQKFVLGETVRSFRILRGGFVRNHQLKTYEDGLCLASQDDVIVVE